MSSNGDGEKGRWVRVRSGELSERGGAGLLGAPLCTITSRAEEHAEYYGEIWGRTCRHWRDFYPSNHSEFIL